MLVLASASPRRKELLTQAGYEFKVIPANIPEERRPDEDPTAFVTRLAQEKAQSVFDQLNRDAPGDPLLVLGADTIVVTRDEILGKPQDAADAARMLRLLSGRTHQVITGICLISKQKTEVAAETTAVTMREISEKEIVAYIATGEPMDKAGSLRHPGLCGPLDSSYRGLLFQCRGIAAGPGGGNDQKAANL